MIPSWDWAEIIRMRHFSRWREEQKHAQEELNAADGKRRETLLDVSTRKQNNKKWCLPDAHEKLMMQLAVSSRNAVSLLQSLKISFSISNTEHMESGALGTGERLYRCGAKHFGKSAKPTDEDSIHLRTFSSSLRFQMMNTFPYQRIKKELGLPDETAVIVVIATILYP